VQALAGTESQEGNEAAKIKLICSVTNGISRTASPLGKLFCVHNPGLA
jgi:hypothetical protein